MKKALVLSDQNLQILWIFRWIFLMHGNVLTYLAFELLVEK